MEIETELEGTRECSAGKGQKGLGILRGRCREMLRPVNLLRRPRMDGNLISGGHWAGSCTPGEREREREGGKRPDRGMSDRASGESDSLTSWGIKRKEK